MKHINLFLIVITAASLTACASRQAATTESTSTSKSAPAKESTKKEAAPEGAIVGKPAAGSKFAKLKIGMTLPQVEKLIGPPTKQWQHPTGKNAIPFYFGPDRWVIQYSYKGEGILTLNSGGDQLLTRIEVNKAE
ncbi:MAG TPA: hypothetical protein DCK83_06240 [Gallionellaceae bacterium]|nr:hypothetical protein [Gallionellaceae bacterium]